MLDKIALIILVIVGIINILPIIVFFDSTKTAKLYGVTVDGESLIILMRHRGVLLSLVGLVLIFAAFNPEFRIFAVTIALISKSAFIYLSLTTSNYTGEIKKVALTDVGAIVLLLISSFIYLYPIYF